MTLDQYRSPMHEQWHDDPCDLDIGNWPYECKAKDNGAGKIPVICRNHMVWWIVEEDYGAGLHNIHHPGNFRTDKVRTA